MAKNALRIFRRLPRCFRCRRVIRLSALGAVLSAVAVTPTANGVRIVMTCPSCPPIIVASCAATAVLEAS